MPIMYFFRCEVCGAESDSSSGGNTPAGWMSLNTLPTPGDPTATPTKYFDKMECLVSWASGEAKS